MARQVRKASLAEATRRGAGDAVACLAQCVQPVQTVQTVQTVQPVWWGESSHVTRGT